MNVRIKSVPCLTMAIVLLTAWNVMITGKIRSMDKRDFGPRVAALEEWRDVMRGNIISVHGRIDRVVEHQSDFEDRATASINGLVEIERGNVENQKNMQDNMHKVITRMLELESKSRPPYAGR